MTGSFRRTPLVRLASLMPGHELYGKAELMLPSGSTYDRIAGRLLDENKDATIVAGSGSLCLAFAGAAALRQRKLTFVWPASTLHEHRVLLKSFGVKLIESPAEEGLLGAHDRALIEAEKTGQQLVYGPRNPDAAARVFQEDLGAELALDFGSLRDAPDAIVAPVGSGALLGGIGRALSDGFVLQTIGACTPDVELVDGVVRASEASPRFECIEVTATQALESRRLMAVREGLLIGLGAAAAISVARQLVAAGRAQRPAVVLVDAGDRYFSRDRQQELHA